MVKVVHIYWESCQSTLWWYYFDDLTGYCEQVVDIQPSVAFHIETNYLICITNQTTAFYMKCNTGLRLWTNLCDYRKVVRTTFKLNFNFRRIEEKFDVRKVFNFYFLCFLCMSRSCWCTNQCPGQRSKLKQCPCYVGTGPRRSKKWRYYGL